MIWPFLRQRVPAGLIGVLGPEEMVLAAADTADGALAVTRFGVWEVPAAGVPVLHGWPVISKARWRAPNLELTIADVAGELGGAQLLVDRPPVSYLLGQPGKLTDLVHSRVRSGIIAADQHQLPGGSGWIVLRRVPGRDGVTPQVRLDDGTDAGHPLLEGAVADLVDDLLAAYRPQG